MMPALIVGAAFAAFALVHSLTVSDAFKSFAANIAGERWMRAWYRLLFTALSAFTAALVVIVYLSQPDTFIFRPPGYVVWPAHAFQLAGVYLLIAASRPFDSGFFTGYSQAKRYLATGRTAGDMEGMPAGALVTAGVYRFVRHPMYLGGMMMFAFEPNLTVNCLVLRALAVLYFVYGGLVEDTRLAAAFGEEYLRYRERVPMFNIVAGVIRRGGRRR